ncbi:hypothetical protein HY312_01420 [Candidatus Saccharibacteria bacterium]|nr:hypothetical protein [Candidatus Saccharibacteria bacterium]
MSETHISTQYGYKRRRRDAIICYNDSSAKYMVTQRIAMIGDQIRKIWKTGRRPLLISIVLLVTPFLFFEDKTTALKLGLFLSVSAFVVHETVSFRLIALSNKSQRKIFSHTVNDLVTLYSRRRSWRKKLKIIRTAPDYRISSG